VVKEQQIERRLAAILAMDVAGYSRLMGVDEVATLRALQAHRKELVDPTIAAHHGRIVKTTGDGLLVEFASVVDAVAATAAIQRGMASRNADVPQERRIDFRAGINIGDVIVEGDDIYVDGVNVAARLQTLSEPGGICISRTVRDHIRDKLPFEFTDLGEHTVKNIARAVRVYGFNAAEIAALPEITAVPPPVQLSIWLPQIQPWTKCAFTIARSQPVIFMNFTLSTAGSPQLQLSLAPSQTMSEIMLPSMSP